HNAILTVVDRCTKMVHHIKTENTCTAEEFAQLMQDHVFSKHGLPTDILTDRDPRFTGNHFQALCEMQNIHHSKPSAWHPQSDGQTERMNRTAEQVLRAFTAQYDGEWDKHLSMVEFAMNNSLHSGLKHTPFFLNTGINPITPIMLQAIKECKLATQKATKATDEQLASLKVPEARRNLIERELAFRSAMEHLKKARDRYKSYADAKRKDVEFQIGDKVLLSSVNLNKHQQARKLYPRFVGPFEILEKVNSVAYKLDLPESMPIHNVFHVSLLKKFIPGKMPIPPPVPIEVDGELEFEVEKILLNREKKTNKVVKKEYYVKWLGYGPEHCTWEPESQLKNAQECLDNYWALQQQLHQAALARQSAKQSATRKRNPTEKPGEGLIESSKRKRGNQ
ncbi:MAG: hypothetical protein ACK52F_00410, partial [bacterium]